MSAAAIARLDLWLAGSAIPADGRAWLAREAAKVAAGDERALAIAFGLAPRKLGKGDLTLDEGLRARAGEVAAGLDPRRWTIAQTARARLLLALPATDPPRWLAALDRLFAAAGLDELVTLYQALPLLPHGDLLAPRAAEGVRSSMRAVFDAVAVDNPFPAARFAEGAWNQMVLKCLFVGSPLARVVGLDQRANPRLTRMLCDYAHERWAARRPVSPEMWRPVGRAADAPALDDLARVLGSGSQIERSAAALALHESAQPDARARLALVPELAAAAASGAISWSAIAADAS